MTTPAPPPGPTEPTVDWTGDPDPSRAGWLNSADGRFRIAVVPVNAMKGAVVSTVLYDYGSAGRSVDGPFHWEFADSVAAAKARALHRLRTRAEPLPAPAPSRPSRSTYPTQRRT